MNTQFWIRFLQKERRVHLEESLVEMAKISAMIYLGTGITGLLALMLPMPEGMDSVTLAFFCIFAVILSFVFYQYRNRFALPFAILQVFIGIPMIALAIWAGHVPTAAFIAIIYVMSSLYSFHFFHNILSVFVVMMATSSFALVGILNQWQGWQSMTMLLLGSLFTVGVIVDLMVKRLHMLATTDSLTGLFNRHTWDTLFEQEINYVKRERTPLTVMLIDLNKFKRINDTKGHHAGDQVLQEVAKTIKEVMRESDIIARLGGDEFVVLLKNCSLRHALQLKARFQQKLEKIVSASVGLADFETGDTATSMLKRADNAMYQDKLLQQQSNDTFVTELD